jgi:aminoglycoside phosphotransferase (APT) family kinase protein
VPDLRPTRIAEGREAEILGWGPGTVLRLYRDPAAGERADRELRVLQAVRSVLPLVPAAHERLTWEGRPGLVLERLEGRDVLAELERRPQRLLELAALCGRVHAELHALGAPEGIPGLCEVLEERIRSHPAIPEALRTVALAILEGLPDGAALCHGDFQPGNVLLCGGGPVVIDWAHATRGDPAGDFARTELMMRLGSLPPGTAALIRWGRWLGGGAFRIAYRRAYSRRCRYEPGALAVERLADAIPEERAGLLREADRLRRRVAGLGSAGRPAADGLSARSSGAHQG